MRRTKYAVPSRFSDSFYHCGAAIGGLFLGGYKVVDFTFLCFIAGEPSSTLRSVKKKRQRSECQSAAAETFLFDVDLVVHQPARTEEQTYRDQKLEDAPRHSEGKILCGHRGPEREYQPVLAGRNDYGHIISQQEVANLSNYEYRKENDYRSCRTELLHNAGVRKGYGEEQLGDKERKLNKHGEHEQDEIALYSLSAGHRAEHTDYHLDHRDIVISDERGDVVVYPDHYADAHRVADYHPQESDYSLCREELPASHGESEAQIALLPVERLIEVCDNTDKGYDERYHRYEEQCNRCHGAEPAYVYRIRQKHYDYSNRGGNVDVHHHMRAHFNFILN